MADHPRVITVQAIAKLKWPSPKNTVVRPRANRAMKAKPRHTHGEVTEAVVSSILLRLVVGVEVPFADAAVLIVPLALIVLEAPLDRS